MTTDASLKSKISRHQEEQLIPNIRIIETSMESGSTITEERLLLL